jgi:hypothetical protein
MKVKGENPIEVKAENPMKVKGRKICEAISIFGPGSSPDCPATKQLLSYLPKALFSLRLSGLPAKPRGPLLQLA